MKISCFQYVKDTKKKANHNVKFILAIYSKVVSNTSKILKRKQITTLATRTDSFICCFQYVKDTKKKANHNVRITMSFYGSVVSNTSKILKRKQITTYVCIGETHRGLFPIRQRY